MKSALIKQVIAVSLLVIIGNVSHHWAFAASNEKNKGKPPDPEKQIAKLEKDLKKAANKEEKAKILIDLCGWNRQLDGKKALEYGLKAIEASRDAGNRTLLSDALGSVAELHLRSGRFKEAEEYNQKSMTIREKLGDNRRIADCYCRMAVIRSILGKRKEAKTLLEQALTLLKKSNDKNGMSSILNNLAILCARSGDFEGALKSYHEAVELGKKMGNKYSLASAYHNIAGIHCEKGNTKKALEYSQKALSLKKELGDRRGMASTLQVIGTIYGDKGNYSRSIEAFLKSLRIHEEFEDKRGMASVYVNLGAIYGQLDNEKKAFECYSKGLKFSTEIGAKSQINACLSNLGTWYERNGDYQKARAHFLEAMDLALQLGDKIDIVLCYKNLGTHHMDQKEYKKSLEYYFKSLETAKEIGFNSGIVDAELAIGNCYFLSGNYPEALSYLNRSLALAKRLNTLPAIRDAALNLSLVHAKQNQFKAAYQNHLLYKKTSDEIKTDEKIKKITQLQMQYDFEKQQRIRELEQQKIDIKKEAELKRQRFLRHSYAVGFLFMFLLAAFIYWGYRSKQKANALLTKQQEEIERQRDELRELNVTKDKFFSIIAHDLKGPFSGLTGFLKVLSTEFDNFDKDDVKELLSSIHQSSENTYNLLNNLLEWSRSQMGKISWQPELIELGNVVKSTVELLKGHARGKGIQVQNDVSEKLEVYADEHMLNTVLRNLISNAVKYTPTGGTVQIGAEAIHGRTTIKISDTGIGIPKQDKQKLFRVGETVTRRGTADEEGTGLGLILCKEFIEKHGGDIWVESNEGKGSIFSFSLPVTTSQAEV